MNFANEPLKEVKLVISHYRGPETLRSSFLSEWKNESLPLVFVTEVTAAAAAAKSLQSCPTLCDPIDGSPLGSPVPGILQARTLEWVAISFSSG